jgi:hypothetical protein
MGDMSWGSGFKSPPKRELGERTHTAACKRRFESVDSLSGTRIGVRVFEELTLSDDLGSTLCKARMGLLGIKRITAQNESYRVRGRFLLAGTSRFLRLPEGDIAFTLKKSRVGISFGDGRSISWIAHGSSIANGVSVVWDEEGTNVAVATYSLFVVNPSVAVTPELLCLLAHFWIIHKGNWSAGS